VGWRPWGGAPRDAQPKTHPNSNPTNNRSPRPFNSTPRRNRCGMRASRVLISVIARLSGAPPYPVFRPRNSAFPQTLIARSSLIRRAAAQTCGSGVAYRRNCLAAARTYLPIRLYSAVLNAPYCGVLRPRFTPRSGSLRPEQVGGGHSFSVCESGASFAVGQAPFFGRARPRCHVRMGVSNSSQRNPVGLRRHAFPS